MNMHPTSNLMYFDEKSKKYVYLMMSNNEVCPHYLHDTHLSRQYVSYNVIFKDLNNVKGIFLELKNTGHNPLIRLSLLHAAATLYGRCFATAERRGIKLERKDVFKAASEQEKETHDFLIDLRNKYVAHAGANQIEEECYTLTLNPNRNEKMILGDMINGIQRVDHELYLESYLEVVEKVRLFVEIKIGQIGNNLTNECLELDIENVYQNSKTPNIDEFKEIDGLARKLRL